MESGEGRMEQVYKAVFLFGLFKEEREEAELKAI